MVWGVWVICFVWVILDGMGDHGGSWVSGGLCDRAVLGDWGFWVIRGFWVIYGVWVIWGIRVIIGVWIICGV